MPTSTTKVATMNTERYQIVIQYKGYLPKTMKTLFRSERRARETLQLLRSVSTNIALCVFALNDQGERYLKEVEEFKGFVE